ncbi:NADH dehydrogenase subunit 6 (mitochondrion) [Plectropomus leopardus]|uniref:NADH-ubiquinone oxidoreductase chain 6 n=1 Tax=Plectropomus leopardus TaxID=160734 RepID=Q07DS6_PLELO|nr:NADH dehydrogenase subunit 6 [Plectropomus leopardus]AAY89410.1 NADH dehydrogenase subunit 6 [Plectropomus leopardus]
MLSLLTFLMVGFLSGMIAVASNPSPFYAALGVMSAAGFGCALLATYGACFLALVLFLIYLGGMLVVFAYSAALASEPHPTTWGERAVGSTVVIYISIVCTFAYLAMPYWYGSAVSSTDGSEWYGLFAVEGCFNMFHTGGGMLVLSAWVLLLTLFVVLELTRGLNRGALRAV